MAHKYCKNCGAKNQYVGTVPKFCSSCGKPFGAIAVAKRVVKNHLSQKPSSEKFNEDETDVDFLPNISKLEYEISPFESKAFKMEDIVNLEENGEEKG
jgi:hypothetical protein